MMRFQMKQPVWVWLVIGVVVVIVLNAMSAMSTGKARAASASNDSQMVQVASSGCPMMGETAQSSDTTASQGCDMMDDSATSHGCGMTETAHKSNLGYALLAGEVTAIDKGKGTVTIKVQPSSADANLAKNTLKQVKVGDKLSLALAIGKDGKVIAPAPTGSKVTAAYACPMHPDVTADKPGTCPKCGMALEVISSRK